MTRQERIALFKELSRRFNEGVVERAPNKKTFKGYDTIGYKYQYIVNRLNEVLGIGGFRTEQQYTISEGKTAKGKPCWSVVCDLTIQLGEYTPNGFVKFADASCIGGHIAGNLADAKKGSWTNAFKKTAALFGVGKQAYEGSIDDDNEPSVDYEQEKPSQPKQETKTEPDSTESNRVQGAIKRFYGFGITKVELERFIKAPCTEWNDSIFKRLTEGYKMIRGMEPSERDKFIALHFKF